MYSMLDRRTYDGDRVIYDDVTTAEMAKRVKDVVEDLTRSELEEIYDRLWKDGWFDEL